MPALLRAEKVAGASQLEVAHGDVEACAETGVLLEGVEAFARLGVDVARGGQKEVRVALA